jgi:hypothetical protein
MLDQVVEPWERRSAFFPILIVTVTLTLWAGFQTVELWRERAGLQTVKAHQETQIQNALKVRMQLDSIAKQMAGLAALGNAGAKTIVEELRKRGVTINLSAAPPTAPQ